MKKIYQNEIDLINAKRKESNYISTISLEKKIKEKVFTIKDIGINYRWLDHWYSKGLLLSNYDTHKWKKFNLIEYVWIKIILKIREFNMGLKTVAVVKDLLDSDFMGDSLFKNPEVNFKEIVTHFAPSEQFQTVKMLLNDQEIFKKIQETRFNLLEMYIMDILLLGNCYSILINSNGTIIPLKHTYLELFSDIQEFQNLIYGSYVSISITEVLRDYILEKDVIIRNKKRLALLSDEETIVLNTVRQNDLKSVVIRFDNAKKINLLEEVREQKIDGAERLAELIMTKGYQDITIKTQNGKIVYCENKKKIAIQNKE